MSQQATDSPLTEEVRFRLPLPVVIPLAALVVIAVSAIGFAQILLNVPKEVAVLLAIVVAANVLGVCAFIALRPETSRAYWAELLIVATYPLVIGIVLAGLNLGSGHAVAEESGAQAEAAEGSQGGLSISASATQFSTGELALPAGEEVQLAFKNEDSLPHNVAIYADDSASQEIFVGDVIEGGQETTYEIKATPKGEYYFQCDVHPAMNGTAVFS